MTTIEKNRVLFVLSSVMLVFTVIWSLVGENNLKILAVFIAFASFLYFGIQYEMNIREKDAH